MMRGWKKIAMMMAAAGLLGTAACSGTTEGGPADSKGGIDTSAFVDGKGDLGKKAKLVDDIGLDSTVEGEFDPRVRVYGYTFQAKKGAKLNIDLEATAGEDARGLEEGETLDTVLALYKDYEGPGEIGEKIIEHDDGQDTLAAPSIDFEAPEDGTYFIVFMSYDDTGAGEYTLNMGCEGTDLQCSRPDFEKPCENGEHYVQGGQIEEDTTWNDCTVVLLEPTVVHEEAILTIKPGVTVKGNFLNDGGNGRFGNVTLTANGTIQAVGTEEHPIAFTSLKENGWGGIVLNSTSNSFEHIYVEKAHRAIIINDEASADVKHSVLEGTLNIDDNEYKGQVGIQTGQEAEATFTHAVVKGFDRGIQAVNSRDLVVEHSIIRDNRFGIRIEGQRATTSCRNRTFNEHRDPVFKHVDIFDNEWGIRIDGSDIFVQVSKSNIINNQRFGIEVRGSGLADGSFINENNIYGNNDATEEDNRTQVRTYHNNDNSLILEKNYWRFISDPELGTSWDGQCNGEISFRGFAPEPIVDAGPIKDSVKEDVFQHSWTQSKQQTTDGE